MPEDPLLLASSAFFSSTSVVAKPSSISTGAYLQAHHGYLHSLLLLLPCAFILKDGLDKSPHNLLLHHQYSCPALISYSILEVIGRRRLSGIALPALWLAQLGSMALKLFSRVACDLTVLERTV